MCPVGCVRTRVREQVGQHLMQPARVAEDADWLVGDLEPRRVLAARGGGVAHRVDDEAGQIDRFARERTA